MTQEEFSRAVQTYGDMIYRVAYHALGSREDAEAISIGSHHTDDLTSVTADSFYSL